ncbi:OLC1v1037045C1 [Oldenlandia corymbosa var. corymbosa]|uniref:OLC1v1037045C1 n=1 Tax=Oldenlandia corymbosa var. corymbosa TaxID=529605 RepID=A0AAV1CXI9_OLDCO|nr:OLC1v1037045C1 [Oldenlandia corymbosa var. corymbosa]
MQSPRKRCIFTDQTRLQQPGSLGLMRSNNRLLFLVECSMRPQPRHWSHNFLFSNLRPNLAGYRQRPVYPSTPNIRFYKCHMNHPLHHHSAYSGSIPSSLSRLQNIVNLHLENNRLTGPIPESFDHFAGETPNLFLSNNFLSGPLPKSLGYVNFTTEFDLSFNNLTGDPTLLFGKNMTLNYILLNYNLFEFDLSNVQFDVSYNKLCGQIPQGGNLQSFGSTAYSHNKSFYGAPLPACG